MHNLILFISGVVVLFMMGCAAQTPLVINDNRVISGRVVAIDQELQVMTISHSGGGTETIRIPQPGRFTSMELVGKYVEVQLQRTTYLTPVGADSDSQLRKIPANTTGNVEMDRGNNADLQMFSAYINKVDHAGKYLYLRNNDGNELVLRMSDNVNEFSRIHADDRVLVKYSDAMVVIVRENESEAFPAEL